jgi:hypothetical protein
MTDEEALFERTVRRLLDTKPKPHSDEQKPKQHNPQAVKSDPKEPKSQRKPPQDR